MSDPRNPPDNGEDIDLGEIEDIDESEAGDEPEAEDDAEPPEGGDDEPGEREPPKRGRASDTIRSLRERAQASERELADLKNQFSELRTQRQPAADPYAQQRAAEAERAELERVSQLPFDEQQRWWNNRTEQRVAQAMQGLEFRLADQSDKTAFGLAAQGSPARARLAGQVEQTLQQYRARGQNAEREVIYKYLRGEELDRAEREGKGVSRQRTDATRRVRSQTTRPASPRGGAAPARSDTRGMDADERFLRNTRIGDVI
jgi:hypothetical protein